MKRVEGLAPRVAFARSLALGASFACGRATGRTVVAEFADVGDLVGRANVQQSDAVVGTGQVDRTRRACRPVAREGHAERQRRARAHAWARARSSARRRCSARSTSISSRRRPRRPAAGGRRGDPGVARRRRPPSSRPSSRSSARSCAVRRARGPRADHDRQRGDPRGPGGQRRTGPRRHREAHRSLRNQKDALASALADLAQASETLDGGIDTLDRALDVSDDALRIVASQQNELEELVVQLDRLGAPLAALTKAHTSGHRRAGQDAQRGRAEAVSGARDARGTRSRSCPTFTKLFARAAPGDYVQLDVFAEAVPIGDADPRVPIGSGRAAANASWR